MKPEKESLKTLQYTQSVAKTIEFEVPKETREIIEAKFSHKPEDIFDIVITLLGEISDIYRNPDSTKMILEMVKKNFGSVQNFLIISKIQEEYHL